MKPQHSAGGQHDQNAGYQVIEQSFSGISVQYGQRFTKFDGATKRTGPDRNIGNTTRAVTRLFHHHRYRCPPGYRRNFLRRGHGCKRSGSCRAQINPANADALFPGIGLANKRYGIFRPGVRPGVADHSGQGSSQDQGVFLHVTVKKHHFTMVTEVTGTGQDKQEQHNQKKIYFVKKPHEPTSLRCESPGTVGINSWYIRGLFQLPGR